MENKKWIIYLSRVKKSIGVILGISCGVEDEPKQRLCDAAFAMDEIVEEILDDICIEPLRIAPTVDAAEVVHGRWVRLDSHKGIEQFKCSVCRSECYVPTCMNEPMYTYCHNCGAKMDGGNEE